MFESDKYGRGSPMMKLYCADGSCSAATHITLEEIGAPYSAHRVDLAAGEQRSEEYLRINPKGKVPALDVDGFVITENVAIQYFLVNQYPEARLQPDDQAGQIRWLAFISWLANTVQPDARHISRPENYCDDPSAFEALRAKGRQLLAKWFAEFDRMLESGAWILGPQYTTADPYALLFVGVGEARGVSSAHLPHLSRWKRDMLSRPAVRKILTAENNVLIQQSECR